jgi:hypothetical protein
MQVVDLGGHDRSAAAAVHPDVSGAALGKGADEVFEELDVATLVRADRDRVDVLVDRGNGDLPDRAVVPKVHDLGAL